MAQFLTLLPVLLLFAVFNPIVCPSSQLHSERRDRAPYIESSENSPQYLGGSFGTIGSRFRKTSGYKDYNQNYRNQEQLPPPPPPPTPSTKSYNAPHTNEDDTNKRISLVFTTNSAQGVHLFNNTAPYRPHFNSYFNEMVDDQPHPHIPPSPSDPSASDKDSFKVQRSPNGKLSIIYNEDLVNKKETEIKNNYTSGSASSNNNSNNNETFANKFQTHFPNGLPLIKDKHESSASTVTENSSKKSGIIHFPTEEPETPIYKYEVDSNDCIEREGTKKESTFCTKLRNYPEKEHLDRIIKEKFRNLESFFGEDLVIPQDITQRMNNEPDEEFLCKSRTRVIYPQAGLNNEYNWLLIVNTANYKQGIRIEECINEGETCGESSGLTVPNSYTATCKQSYIYRSLVAYTNETVLKDQFRIPSCCKCVLKSKK